MLYFFMDLALPPLPSVHFYHGPQRVEKGQERICRVVCSYGAECCTDQACFYHGFCTLAVDRLSTSAAIEIGCHLRHTQQCHSHLTSVADISMLQHSGPSSLLQRSWWFCGSAFEVCCEGRLERTIIRFWQLWYAEVLSETALIDIMIAVRPGPEQSGYISGRSWVWSKHSISATYANKRLGSSNLHHDNLQYCRYLSC